MGRFKEAARRTLSHIVVASGATRISRRLRSRNGTLVFYGHRVAADDEGYLQGLAPEWLDEQLAYLTRHYEVIPLSTLVRCLEERQPVPQRSAVLTFDDGFRDNYEQAFPLLRRHRVSATIFLVTGSISSGDLPWPQRLGIFFQRTEKRELLHPLTGDAPAPLTSAARRNRAYQAITAFMRAAGGVDRERLLAELARRLEVEPPRDRMLTWEQAREMLAQGVEFGAHTYSHPFLARIPVEEARWEMERSRDDLRERLGIERPPFCFPAGSMSATLIEMVRELGFRSCFQIDRRRRVNTAADAEPYSLHRLGLPNAPGLILEAELDGPFHAVRNLYRS